MTFNILADIGRTRIVARRHHAVVPASGLVPGAWLAGAIVKRRTQTVGTVFPRTPTEPPQGALQPLRLRTRLTKYGLSMPMIDPVKTGIKEYDKTWNGYHLTFLKHLHRVVRNNEFDFAEWNIDVSREADKRKIVITPH